jgi:enterochelin esterase-like enzyme
MPVLSRLRVHPAHGRFIGRAILFLFVLVAGLGLPVHAAAPIVAADRSATVSLAAPHAGKVLILADFIADRAGVPMQRGVDGTWTYRTGPLEYGFYSYRFSVDGLIVSDPANPPRKRGTLVSTLEVRGSEPFPEDVDERTLHGVVHIETISCASLGQGVKCYVYTPPSYATSQRKYPVLYLLHGGSGDPSNWTVAGYADVMADNLIGRSRMKEMIIVMPHAEFPRKQPYTAVARRQWLDTFQQHLTGEVMPWIEQRYRISGKREDRWLAGLSNGGSQTLHVGFRRPDLFSVIAPFSTRLPDGFATDYPLLKDAVKFNADIRLFYFACGEQDHNWEGFKANHADLEKLGIKHEWKATTGAHNWYNWRRYLADLLPRL